MTFNLYGVNKNKMSVFSPSSFLLSDQRQCVFPSVDVSVEKMETTPNAITEILEKMEYNESSRRLRGEEIEELTKAKIRLS